MLTDGNEARYLRSSFSSWYADRQEEICGQLEELISFPTLTPNEDACHRWLADHVSSLGGVATVITPPAEIVEHPDFTFTGIAGQKTLAPNLHARFDPPPASRGRILFNAHLDVVPALDPRTAFAPRRNGGAIVGRGSADTKGNIVMLFAALEFLRDAGLQTRREVVIDFVAQEEVGGNGTLASIIRGCDADEIVVLEPTSLDVYYGHRGCLSFEVSIQGAATHMGAAHAGLNAIDGAFRVIQKLKRLERRLTAEARFDPDFARWPRPTPINVGFIQGGQWHGSIPERCVVGGNMGFLPGYSVDDAKRLLEDVVSELPLPWSVDRFTLTYSGIHNEAYRMPVPNGLVDRLEAAKRKQGVRTRRPCGWTASCDARIYFRLLQLPVIVFGCGDLDQAHSEHEQLDLAQLRTGALALSQFLLS
jgi:acetylornithine deacetylase